MSNKSTIKGDRSKRFAHLQQSSSQAIEEEIRKHRLHSIDSESAKSSDAEPLETQSKRRRKIVDKVEPERKKRLKKRRKRLDADKVDPESLFQRFCSTTKQMFSKRPGVEKRQIYFKSDNSDETTENDVVASCYGL